MIHSTAGLGMKRGVTRFIDDGRIELDLTAIGKLWVGRSPDQAQSEDTITVENGQLMEQATNQGMATTHGARENNSLSDRTRFGGGCW
jgi:hypothetical protein